MIRVTLMLVPVLVVTPAGSDAAKMRQQQQQFQTSYSTHFPRAGAGRLRRQLMTAAEAPPMRTRK
jgi:hypothetical protein